MKITTLIGILEKHARHKKPFVFKAHGDKSEDGSATEYKSIRSIRSGVCVCNGLHILIYSPFNGFCVLEKIVMFIIQPIEATFMSLKMVSDLCRELSTQNDDKI